MDTANLHRLATRVLNDRLARASVIGADSKGRTLVEWVGTPTAAEQEWDALAPARTPPSPDRPAWLDLSLGRETK